MKSSIASAALVLQAVLGLPVAIVSRDGASSVAGTGSNSPGATPAILSPFTGALNDVLSDGTDVIGGLLNDGTDLVGGLLNDGVAAATNFTNGPGFSDNGNGNGVGTDSGTGLGSNNVIDLSGQDVTPDAAATNGGVEGGNGSEAGNGKGDGNGNDNGVGAGDLNHALSGNTIIL